MPLLSIETNQRLQNSETLSAFSQTVAKLLGKPESYVMIKYEHNTNMLFAANDQPLAHLKLKSLGMPEDKTAEYSAELCQLMQTHFDVPAERVYIEFANPERHMWGWDSATF
jgi:phenylpyruvate tautomerase PptA (4-oxalocrotonate tautomerase family)